MHYKQIVQTPKTFILILETGDDLAEGLNRFAIEQQLSPASLKAVGALSSVRLGWFSGGSLERADRASFYDWRCCTQRRGAAGSPSCCNRQELRNSARRTFIRSSYPSHMRGCPC